MHAELDHIWIELADDPGIHVVILTGEGQAFSAGGDLKRLAERRGHQVNRLGRALGEHDLRSAFGIKQPAHRLAGHFVVTVDDSTKKDIWGPAAQELITSLLLAAASSGRTLHAVSRWLDDPATPTPAAVRSAAVRQPSSLVVKITASRPQATAKRLR